MNGVVLDRFLAFLKAKPASIPWSEGHEIAYEIGLDDDAIPNEAFVKLVKAINDECTFRPEVSEIKSIWRRMNGQGRREHEIVGEIRTAIAKYGACGQRVPGTNFYRPGPPPELSEEALRTVNHLGGWVRVAEDAQVMESGVFVGHLRGIARSVEAGASDERLRLLGSKMLQALDQQRALTMSEDENELDIAA